MTATVTAMLKIDPLALHYKVELSPAEAREFVQRAGEYNAATPEVLTRLIDDVGALIPPMYLPMVDGKPNLNNGKTHHRFEIGREYSRVLYLTVIHAYLPKDFDYSALVRACQTLAGTCHTNEASQVDADDPYRFTFRFWWD